MTAASTKTVTVKVAHKSSLHNGYWVLPVGWEPQNEIDWAEFENGSYWNGKEEVAGLVVFGPELEEGQTVEVNLEDLRIVTCGDCRVIGEVELTEGDRTMTTTQTISLREFNNESESGINYLWLVSTANPAGVEYHHDTETEIDEDYLDFSEFDLLERLYDLNGTVEGSTWTWDGKGDPRDFQGNSILNIVAR